MTKKDIVKIISESTQLPQSMVKDVVQQTFDAIIELLSNSGHVELRNFGVFKIKYRKPRKARNPKTNESVMASGRHVVTFRAGKNMQDKMDATFSDTLS